MQVAHLGDLDQYVCGLRVRVDQAQPVQVGEARSHVLHELPHVDADGVDRTLVLDRDDGVLHGLRDLVAADDHARLVGAQDGDAPRRICQSTAKEKCTTLFADGATTSSSWEFRSQDCFDASGQPTSVSSNIDFCQDFSTLVSNDFGWGKEGEPWHANQPKPATC